MKDMDNKKCSIILNNNNICKNKMKITNKKWILSNYNNNKCIMNNSNNNNNLMKMNNKCMMDNK